MIQYILEILAFQLLFLVVYDLFLKRETFFQWNRFYLISTFILATILPWIKIEAFKTTVSQEFVGYPVFFWELDGIAVTSAAAETSWLASLPTAYIVFGIGALLSALWFGYKLFQIYWLKEKGTIHYYKDFTKVVVKKSELAFSFFKNIFLGEQIKKENEANIVAHELVHIKQWHSLDLLFFELMRIAFWFNPLVYVYQNRVSELHEFIADSVVAKTNKREQYQLLLAEAFQTQNISFVNQFFKKSLIKKRIIMLSKTKSKKIYQFKYLLLVPLVLGMLVYSSCEQELPSDNQEVSVGSSSDDAALIAKVNKKIDDGINKYGSLTKYYFKENNTREFLSNEIVLSKEDFFTHQILFKKFTIEITKNDLDFRQKLISHLKSPSSKTYQSYVERSKAFRVLDENLKHSLNQKDFSVRLTTKDDKNLGAGEFIKVSNVKDLTGDEIRKVNQALESIKGSGRFVSLSDNDYSFLITNALYSIDDEVEIISVEEVQEPLNIKTGEPIYNSSVPFAVVDEVPIFPGCESASDKVACFTEKVNEHIRKHFNYPLEAQEAGIQGRVSTVFTITEDGTIQNIRMRGSDAILEAEVKRIIERLPKMQPGKQDGQAVAVPFSIPITFKLKDGEDINIKKDIAQSLQDILRITGVDEVLPTGIGLNKNIEKTIGKYNKLVVERKRLLKSASKENPIIKNLDEDLMLLKLKIEEELKINAE